MDVINKNTADCPIKDLLQLISNDDVDQLRSTLLEIIYNFAPKSELYLYEHGYSLYEASDKQFSPNLVACRSNDEDCFKSAQRMQVKADSDSIYFDGFKYLPTDDFVQVFTVESERSSRGLLITTNNTVIDEHYIYTLLSVYNHQIYLLRNKDTDSLTGLLNRQSFDTKSSKLYKDLEFKNRSNDKPNKFSLALLDIDHFKNINDKFGHVYGDEVLILFSNIMKKTFRNTDLLFRYGGEEFAVLIDNVDLTQADTILNRFKSNIEDFNFPMDNKVTTSVGYCEFNNELPLTSLIERADKALYYSKENGRNKVSNFELLRDNKKIQDTIIDEGDIELF